MHSKKPKARHSAHALAAAAVTLATGANLAQAADPQDQSNVGADLNAGLEVIVTGTRRQGIEAIDSSSPIQVLDSNVLVKTGQPDLIQALAQNLPSFTAQSFGGDTANLTLSARLRGLSPNHALVLVDGKRRHTTANLAVLGGPYQGGAAADLNFIPVSAIERIEVLQDGAAAQYGTDAIAGVVNIILKKNAAGGGVNVTGGGYMDEGGDTGDVSGNIGFAPSDGSFINFTAEGRTHDRSDRSGIDPRVTDPDNLAAMPQLRDAPGYPYLNHIQGDAAYHIGIASLNSGMAIGDSMQAYANATYGQKHAHSYENYRMPNRIPAIYPLGFNPEEEAKEKDYGATVGLKGKWSDTWNWDLSTTYGKDDVEINTINSGNVALYQDTGSTPTDFHAGDFISTQWTTTADVNRDYEIGMFSPLNVAFGVEHRKETYEIKPGDPASRYKEGAQSFPGFALTDAGSHDRDNNAVYVDFAGSPVEKLQLDVAGRYEHFSDFGHTTIGKVSGRYDFTESFALRSTFSTGFRAPTLAEEYYSATNVGPTSAFVQLPPNSPAAALVGINGLKPEKAKNFSVGFVAHMFPKLVTTLDAYQIEINDRVVGSGSLYGVGGAVNSQAVSDAIAANGNVLDPTVTFQGISIFSNGLDTRTRGVELVATYPSEFSFGRIDWSVAANYNETEVTSIAPSPAQLVPQTFFDPTAISTLEDSSPKYRSVLTAAWSLDRFSATLRETLYGPSSQLESPDGGIYYETKIAATPITDLELTYSLQSTKLTLGANNLFNRYPSGVNKDLLQAYRDGVSNSAVTIYPSFSPFGINGGYYYAKLAFSF
jgi:iron complex outermembrane receptor protein